MVTTEKGQGAFWELHRRRLPSHWAQLGRPRDFRSRLAASWGGRPGQGTSSFGSACSLWSCGMCVGVHMEKATARPGCGCLCALLEHDPGQHRVSSSRATSWPASSADAPLSSPLPYYYEHFDSTSLVHKYPLPTHLPPAGLVIHSWTLKALTVEEGI